MDKLHLYFMNKDESYSKWHNRFCSTTIHWVFLVSFVTIFATSLIINIEKVYDSQLAAVASVTQIQSTIRSTMATASLVPKFSQDHILVKFKSGTTVTKKNLVLAKYSLEEKNEIPHIGWKIVSIPSTSKVEDVVNKLKKQETSTIQDVSLDTIVKATIIPNDTLYNQQWHLPKIQTPEAWDISTGDTNIVIAIIDSGVNTNHPDLAQLITPGWNFYSHNTETLDTYGHGTAVAGTAVAVSNNNVGIASTDLFYIS